MNRRSFITRIAATAIICPALRFNLPIFACDDYLTMVRQRRHELWLDMVAAWDKVVWQDPSALSVASLVSRTASKRL